MRLLVPTPMVEQIHLLHHTHVDFGYTDLPSTMRRRHVADTLEALALIEQNAHRPEGARFRWTIEVAEIAREVLAGANEALVARLQAARAAGLLDVGAMPWHPTGFSGAAEWEALCEKMRPVREVLKPGIAVLNDINGLAWALVPRLLEQGVRGVSMGINTHSGRTPMDPPAFFQWEGPDGRTIPVHMGFHYCQGYYFFHAAEWRCGPVPHSSDVFYAPPERGDIWAADEASLAGAEAILQKALAGLSPAYPFATLGLQVTNMWRLDNDPPFAGLCDFVEAWNASGRSPRLRLSTFEQFFAAIQADPAFGGIPVYRGDWANWWADGIAALPRENVAVGRAVATLSDLESLQELTDSKNSGSALSKSAWGDIALFHEHTVDSYNAMSNPAGFLSLGHKTQTSQLAFRAWEDARCALAEVLRSSPTYAPMTRAKAVTVCNAGAQARSGWIEVPATAFRAPVDFLHDPETGEDFPFWDEVGPVWSEPKAESTRPFEIPDDTFSFTTTVRRAFLPHVAARSTRRLIFKTGTPAEIHPPDHGFSWCWNASRIESLRLSGKEWVHSDSPFGFGQIVIDEDHTFGARWYQHDFVAERVRAGRSRSTPTIERLEVRDTPWGQAADLVLKHPLCHRIEQCWLNHHTLPRLELQTTFWFRESFIPTIIALTFPFHCAQPELAYTSLGVRTRVGHDQLSGCCGEFAFTEGALFARDLADDAELCLTANGMPLAAFDEFALYEDRRAQPPRTASIFSIPINTHWMTNFPHLTPGKLTIQHVISPHGPAALLYAFPSV